jgi:hypothetical protein
MAVKKPADALKAKQRKQKIFVVVGFVALIGAAVYEVPMLMKGSGSAAPPPPAETSTVPGTTGGTPTSLAPPTPGSSTAAPVAGVGQLVDTDVPPQPTQSRLVGFSLFPSKDPFVQQVSPVSQTAGGSSGSGSGAGSGSGSSGGAASKADKPAADVPSGESVVPPTSGPGSSGSSGETTVQTVTISVNGKQEAVGKGGTFPRSAPSFRLVSFGDGTAEIGIVGGSYASGGETVTLKQGVPLTLVNTTDDTRYRIVLVRTP